MKRILTVFALVWLGGCSWLPDKIDETKTWSASKLYSEAKDRLNSGDYTVAIEYFEKLEARYPYGRYAQQSQLEVAYAYYKDGEAASAIAACDRFIKLHPTHEHVDYAYYLKGLANFTENSGLFSFISDQDMSERDPKAARDAYQAFRDLVSRFPESRYADDSSKRMRYLVNALAAHEVHVANYYMRRGAYLAAANRAQAVLKDHPATPAVEEALGIMFRAYDKLGLTQLRDDAKRVLDTNYPNSPYAAGPADKKVPWWQLWNRRAGE